jgi:nucleotide-binding universal stress UspA family protein
MTSSNTVVVGVDGSEPSSRALRYAVEEAHRRAARLLVVTAFEPPEYWDVVYGGPATFDTREMARGVERRTQTMIDEVLADDPAPPPVELRIVPCSAVQALLAASNGMTVLVLGHRGLGGMASALVGSVGLQCVLHATCPVTVVPPESPDQSRDPEPAAAAGADR